MSTHGEGFKARDSLQLLQDQLDGMTAWQASVRLHELSDQARRESREAVLEARRRLDGLRRANAALLARSEQAIRHTQEMLRPGQPRAVVAHRQDWMREKLVLALGHQGISVLADVEDGADVLGISVAEQPDLVVVEDRLPSIMTVEVVRSLTMFAPHTVVAAQVGIDGDVSALLHAGASAVFSRRIPPAEVCERISAYLRERPDRALLLT